MRFTFNRTVDIITYPYSNPMKTLSVKNPNSYHVLIWKRFSLTTSLLNFVDLIYNLYIDDKIQWWHTLLFSSCCFNSLRPSESIYVSVISPSLLQIMACHLVGANIHVELWNIGLYVSQPQCMVLVSDTLMILISSRLATRWVFGVNLADGC